LLRRGSVPFIISGTKAGGGEVVLGFIYTAFSPRTNVRGFQG